MQEIIDGWAVADVEVFAPSPRGAKVHSLRSRSSRRAASQLSEHRALLLALHIVAWNLCRTLCGSFSRRTNDSLRGR